MTRAKSRLTVLLAFFAVLTMCLGIAFMPKQEAFAAVDTSTGFYVEDGASARLVEGQSGIKWTVHITKTAYNKIVTEKGAVTGAGLEIRPSGTDSEGNEYAWTPFTYGGTLVFGEEETSEYVFPYAIYYDEIINDMNAKLIEQGEDKLTAEEEKAYLAQAYAMNLEVRPFVKGLQANGDEYVSYGEADDTSRSLQGVALAYLVQDIVAEGTTEYNTLVSYIPGTYNEIEKEFKAENSFYSNVDASGVVAIDEAIPMANAKIYYGAKEVTDLYSDGVVNLSGVQTKVTEDGTCSDYLTILDTASGDVYKQEFVGVTLAIDHYEDFAYFTQKTNLDCETDDSLSLYVDDGDMEYDGYYVLLQDVDCTGYTHDHTQGSKYNIDGRSWGAQATKNLLQNKGLTGTFDGRGYTIQNLAISATGTQSLGLFGYINGGTLKNTAFYNLNGSSTMKNSGVLAYALLNNAVVENCYFHLGVDFTCGYDGSWIADTVDEGTTFKNLLFNAPISHSYQTVTSYPFFGGLSEVEDCFIISNHPVELNGTTRKKSTVCEEGGTPAEKTLVKVAMDAEYVDGVERTYADRFYTATRTDITWLLATYEVVFDSAGTSPTTFARGSTYPITQIKGLKRYTTTEKMTENKESNSFDTWNADVWTIVDGVPTFKNALVNDYSYYADDALIGEEGVGIEANKSFDVSVELDGAKTGINPVLAVVSGQEFASIEGTTVTALAKGKAVISITYGSSYYEFDLTVTPAPIAYENELYFSAHDGQFYDNDFNIVDVATIFGVDAVEIVGSYDKDENILTVSDNKILGLDLGKQSTWANNVITLSAKDAAYRVNVIAADAIIDEAVDLAVLSPQGNGTLTSTSISYDGDDFIMDGYYVMVKDVNAHNEGYYHHTNSTSTMNLDTPKISTVAASPYGFSGVFDGQGHTISHLYVQSLGGVSSSNGAGLFTWLNGGVVKNVSFNNIYGHGNGANGVVPPGANKSSNTTALIATYMVNGARLDDVRIVFGRMNGFNSRLLYRDADKTCSLNRVYMQYTGTTTFNAGGGGLYASNSATFNDVYYVSPTPVRTAGRLASAVRNAIIETIADGTQTVQEWIKVAEVSATIDGVAQGDTVNYVLKSGEPSVRYDFDTYNVYQATAITEDTLPLTAYSVSKANIKQYTTLKAMQDDAANNAFTGWDSTLWTITNGVPNMNVIG